jgi:hypothetical protein
MMILIMKFFPAYYVISLSLALSLSTLFSSISFVFFPNIRDQVLHPYETTGKIVVSYVLVFIAQSV